MKKLVIYTDGASQGNPGRAAIGVTLRDEKGALAATISRGIGKTTNNHAEYQAVIAALEKAVSLGADSVELNSDSELIVKQIKGQYRVKKESLKPLYEKVIQLKSRFAGFKIKHIPRELNKKADKLANAALD
ncbi:ribonuclease HI family protein [Chloroflexota bacterium]